VFLRLTGLLLLALAVLGASLLAGGTAIAPADVAAAILHPHAGGDIAISVWQIRMPRACVAAFVGVQLAVAGALMQGMLRNPLVDPYLTGTSAGAGAAIAVAIVAGAPPTLIPAIGFVAGLITALLVAALARRGTGLDATRLILAGVSLSALFSAFITIVLIRQQNSDYAVQIISTLAGSLAGRGWHDIAAAVPYTIAGLALSAAAAPALNALRVGDVRAIASGVNVNRAHWLILAAAALLTATAVALSGIVGFLGLIVPHVARRVVGTDARVLLPASAFLGAALCATADAVSRTIVAPAELPIGIVLAFVGVPAFLYLYVRRERVVE
jgi:iron complex transport system permease protein